MAEGTSAEGTSSGGTSAEGAIAGATSAGALIAIAARASRTATACDARTNGVATIAVAVRVMNRDMIFIGGRTSGAARETGGNGRANAGEHLLTIDRAINHGAILRRGFGVELNDLREDVLEILEQLATAEVFRSR